MTDDNVYSFDVTISTHDLLRAGIIAGRFWGASECHHRIVVSADSFTDAHLTAAQMASCHGICTGVYLRV